MKEEEAAVPFDPKLDLSTRSQELRESRAEDLDIEVVEGNTIIEDLQQTETIIDESIAISNAIEFAKEQTRLDAETKLDVEADLSKLPQTEAQAIALEEQARLEAEAKAVSEEVARLTVEANAASEEKARLEVEAKAVSEEKARLEAEAFASNQELSELKEEDKVRLAAQVIGKFIF